MVGCKSNPKPTNIPTLKQGVLDLNTWSFEENPTIQLKGEWKIYWKKLLTPTTVAQQKPSAFLKLVPSWKGEAINGQKLAKQAYATYYAQVKINKSKVNTPLAIKLNTSEVAYKLFINGKLTGKIGQIGTAAKTNSPIYSTNIYTFSPQSTTIDIVLQISNYNAYVNKLVKSVELGHTEYLYDSHQQSLNINFLLFGSLLIIALYHFSLFYYRRDTPSPIYFGLLCSIIAIRILTLSELNLTDIFPWFDFEWHEKFSHLTFYTATLVVFIFIRSVFTDEFPRLIGKAVPIVIWPFILLVTFTHSRIFSKVLPVFQLITVVSIFIGFYVLIKASLNKKHGARAFLFGFVAIAFTAVHDIFYAIGLIYTGHLFPWGLFIFILSQAVALSGRFSRAFVQSEELGKKLNDLNQQLENQVQIRTESLEKTREELQVKNDNITASISYAQRIQDAILPGWNNVQQYLPESFLMFLPRDLVSGDFYWFAVINSEIPEHKERKDEQDELMRTTTAGLKEKQYKVRGEFLEESGQVNEPTRPNIASTASPSGKLMDTEKLVIAAVDCTGHGVPGAFMSLIGNNLLNQIVLERKILSPDLILSELNKEVRNVLKQDETQNRDGMDIALVVIDQKNQTLEFAGAKNPLYLIQNQKLRVIKGNKTAIGGKQPSGEILYDKHLIDISQPTEFYLSSDGFQDQFGGPEGRKFMVRAFRKLLFDIHHLPMIEQQKILENTLEDWKQNKQEQVDDILVIGVKLAP